MSSSWLDQTLLHRAEELLREARASSSNPLDQGLAHTLAKLIDRLDELGLADPDGSEPDLNPAVVRRDEKLRTRIGRAMRAARMAAGLKPGYACIHLGLRPLQLRELEDGLRLPQLVVLLKAVDVYGTTMDDLCGLTREDDPELVARLYAARLTHDRRLVWERQTAVAIEFVRQEMPTWLQCERVAQAAVDLEAAMTQWRAINPEFDASRGGAPVDTHLRLMSKLATELQAQMRHARRRRSAHSVGAVAPILPLLALLLDPLPTRDDVPGDGPATEAGPSTSIPASPPALPEATAYERVISLAKAGKTPTEIAAKVEVHKSTVSRHMARGRESGDLPCDPSVKGRISQPRGGGVRHRAKKGG